MKPWIAAFLTLLASGCFLAAVPAQSSAATDIVGIWMGKLDTGGVSLRIVFKIVRKPDMSLAATMDSPDQGAKNIPMDTAVFAGGKVTLTLKVAGGSFEGTLNEAGTAIDGTWTQHGAVFPLKLARTTDVPEQHRPQEPHRPYPYAEVEVSVANKSADVVLAGTLTLPRTHGPFPAVFLITGSGPQNRDEALMGHKPFLVLSDYLTRRGIAVLRVDDRGTAKSTGNFATATTADFAGDARACVEFLKTRKEINPKQIGLIGHSEGGLIAPMLAAQSKDIAFIVMMAGTGLPGEQILYLQAALINKVDGASDAQIAANRALQEKMFSLMKREQDPVKLEAGLQAVVTAEIEKLPAASRPPADKMKATVNAQVASVMSPWFRYFLTCDPRNYLRQVHCPVLAINGSRDLQVPPKDNLPEIEAALKAAGNRDYTVKMLPELNHLFQKCATGSPKEYSQIEETIDPSALKAMGDWIVAHTGRTP